MNRGNAVGWPTASVQQTSFIAKCHGLARDIFYFLNICYAFSYKSSGASSFSHKFAILQEVLENLRVQLRTEKARPNRPPTNVDSRMRR